MFDVVVATWIVLEFYPEQEKKGPENNLATILQEQPIKQRVYQAREKKCVWTFCATAVRKCLVHGRWWAPPKKLVQAVYCDSSQNF